VVLPIIQQDQYLEGKREKFDQERRDFSAEIFGRFGRRAKKAMTGEQENVKNLPG
jgi:hypothetical protein